MAKDGNSTAEVAYDDPQAESSSQSYQETLKGLLQGQLPYPVGLQHGYAAPSTLELPLSQVSTGKANKAGQPSRMKTWVTAELARVVAKAQSQGAVRVSITITPIFE